MCRTSAARMSAARNECDIPPRLAIITNSSYMLNLGFLSIPNGLEEAHVVHRPGPGHFGDRMSSSFAMSCPIVTTCPIWGLYLIPMS